MTYEFQALSWVHDDGHGSNRDVTQARFTARIFGRARDGRSIGVNVRGFAPSFCVAFDPDESYVENYENLADLLRKQLKDWDLSSGVPEETADYSDHLLHLPSQDQILRKKSIWGFTNGQLRPFFQYKFKSGHAYRKLKNFLQAFHKNDLSQDEMQDFYDEVKAIRTQKGTDRSTRDSEVNDLITSFVHERRQYGDKKRETDERRVLTKVLRWIIKLGTAGLPFSFAKGKLYDVIDPLLRVGHSNNIKMAGWIQVAKADVVEGAGKVTTCALELDADYDDLAGIECDDISPFIKEMAFDIEAYSHDRKFPDPSDPKNCIFQIGIAIREYGSKDVRRILIHFRTPVHMRGNESGRCGAIPNTRVINVETERELLEEFTKIILQEDPDVLEGYNSDNFDWNSAMVRGKHTGCESSLGKISRLKNHVCTVEKGSLSSKAFGDNKYLRVDIPGRLNVDLMVWVQRSGSKYPDYKLDTVAEKELGMNKNDMEVEDIFRAHETGEEALCTKVGAYCCQDTVLLPELSAKLDVLTSLFGMANITSTPPVYLLHKGQQIKVFSQIAKEAGRQDFLIPLANDVGGNKESFTGARVLPPKPGFYPRPVITLDFAGLYPSIQRAYRICYSTILLIQCRHCRAGGEKPCQRSEGVACMDNLPGVEYETIPWTEKGKSYAYRYVQNQPNVIPELQAKLKASRSAVKKAMAAIENSEDPNDQLRYRVLNGRQLAIKVSMNSIYGFTSAFMMNLMALSATVTAKGRQMIETTRDFMTNHFEAIARSRIWTIQESMTYFDTSGREVLADMPQDGWVRKYPSAVAGRPWTEKPLDICVVGGDTGKVFSTTLYFISMFPAYLPCLPHTNRFRILPFPELHHQRGDLTRSSGGGPPHQRRLQQVSDRNGVRETVLSGHLLGQKGVHRFAIHERRQTFQTRLHRSCTQTKELLPVHEGRLLAHRLSHPGCRAHPRAEREVPQSDVGPVRGPDEGIAGTEGASGEIDHR